MRKIVILGAGESGCGAAVLAKKEGYEVLVSDSSAIAPHYKQMLESHSIEWEEQHHSIDRILQADLIIKSPGIPDTVPVMKEVLRRGIKVVSEIEFAGRFTSSKMICITGSNGKTTTTSLIYHIMQRAGFDVGLAGNIGKSLALQVAEQPRQWYVIELSSFQLDNMYDFKADIAVLLNITPDHLDRYGFDMERYAAAKMRITQNQKAADSFIFWADDPIASRLAKTMTATPTQRMFSDRKADGLDGYTDGGTFVVRGATDFSMPVADLALRGRHNIYNQLAAAIAARQAGVADEALRSALMDFPGVEHRLERAGEVGGVEFVNDSKATNVDACFYALEAQTRPTILIVGGRDKGNDYSVLYPLIRQKCKAIVYLGADNAKLHASFDHLGLPVADTHSMNDCLTECVRLAEQGDTVLLSPCCASFDLFRNMEDRGEQFKTFVKNLASNTAQ